MKIIPKILANPSENVNFLSSDSKLKGNFLKIGSKLMNAFQPSINFYICFNFIIISLRIVLTSWAFYSSVNSFIENSHIHLDELIGKFNRITLRGENFAVNSVIKNELNFKIVAHKYDIDPDLLKSIMMEEMSHADPIERYPKYEKFLPECLSKTRGVMQVTINSNQPYHKKINAIQAADDFQSIEAAAFLVFNERRQLIKEGYVPTVETIGSRYNNHSAKGVTRYGIEVRYYYNTKPWLQIN